MPTHDERRTRDARLRSLLIWMERGHRLCRDPDGRFRVVGRILPVRHAVDTDIVLSAVGEGLIEAKPVRTGPGEPADGSTVGPELARRYDWVLTDAGRDLIDKLAGEVTVTSGSPSEHWQKATRDRERHRRNADGTGEGTTE